MGIHWEFMANTKIVATLGPATDSLESVKQLIEAGADVFRLNMSHGNAEQHAARVRLVREASAGLRRNAAILADLQGPKIRLGTFENGGCTLATGSRFTLTTEPVTGNCQRASTSYAELAKDVKPGDRVLLADGSIELRVLAANGIAAECEVVSGGPISDRKGINLPGVQVSTPSLTRKDIADLRFAIEQGVDMVALSFVRRRDDVLRLRVHMEDNDARIPIISKIEKPEAFSDLDAILEESDGVMVARGDLGVEVALERVPSLQKTIIRRARRSGKFVITATQMLESMIGHNTPTRAEVSDVANAIFDGTDAVMLSGETSIGKYPVETVRMMERIAVEAERTARPRDLPAKDSPTHADIVADSAYRAAQAAGARAIAVFTTTGFTARLVARFRPAVPIYAFTSTEAVVRQLQPVFGVRATQIPQTGSTDQMVTFVDRVLIENGLVSKGDTIVLVAGQPVGRAGTTNLLKLHRAGDAAV
jgi:pyruvate kinase